MYLKLCDVLHYISLKFRQVWISLDKFGQDWTSLDQFQQVWTYLKLCDVLHYIPFKRVSVHTMEDSNWSSPGSFLFLNNIVRCGDNDYFF